MIDWCNTNTGFMSALLSFTSVVLSLVAIWFSFRIGENQVKATLFDKKLKLFSAVNRIYKQCIQLSKIKDKASLDQKIRLTGLIVFRPNEKEFDLLRCRAGIVRQILVADKDEIDELNRKDLEIGDQSVQFIIREESNIEEILDSISLLYPSAHYDEIETLLKAYSDYLLYIFSHDEEPVSNSLTEIRKAVENVKRVGAMDELRKGTRIDSRLFYD